MKHTVFCFHDPCRLTVHRSGALVIHTIVLVLAYGSTVLAAPNDSCDAASLVGEGVPAAQGSNDSADQVDEFESTCVPSDYDVWFAYTAGCSGIATVDTFNSEQADTTLSAYSACGGEELACNDDTNGLLSQIAFQVSNGTTYWLRVASLGLPGDFDLNITCEAFPDNDSCPSATVVTDGVPAWEGVNTGAGETDDAEATCVPSDFDVWFTYLASCTGAVRVDTVGSLQADTVLSVYDGGCNEPEVACSDDSVGQQAAVLFDVIEGQPYLIRLASAGTPGDYDVNIQCLSVPANQDCESAQSVTDGMPSTEGDNTGAVLPDDDEASCQPSDRDVWFAYQATCSGGVIVSTIGSEQSDVILSAYDSCGGNEVACLDDVGGLQSEIIFPVTLGELSLLRLASFGSPGDYDVNISCLGIPSNDSCASALPVSDGAPAAIGQSVGAVGSVDDQLSCGVISNNDVWFEYSPSASGPVTIDTFSSEVTDTVLTVYDSCGGSEIVCNDDTDGLLSQVFLQVEAGESYFIRLASIGRPGNYTLNINVPRPAGLLADSSIDVFGNEIKCTSDDDCLNESVCLGDRCYAPKHRYLSIEANPANAG
ncbi:MAG: hypothetical protein ACPGXK_12375, partial [Phycisphaerae bacterium]